MLDDTHTPAVSAQRRMAAFGAAIRNARGDQIQVAFATRLGVAQTTISQWESGLQLPPPEQMLLIEEILGLPKGWFLVRAGFVERDALLPDGEVISTSIGDFDEIHECLTSAERLGFGVHLWNEDVREESDPDSASERWVLSVLRSATSAAVD